MPIYLIRHTTPEIDHGMCYGQSDIDVAHTFPTELAGLASQIESLNISKIYSSPLKRSHKLAAALSVQFNIPIQVDDRLKELNFGDWEMHRWDSLLPTELNMWMTDFVNLCTPHGESYLQMHKRVSDFLNHTDLRNALIISHSGVMRSILCSLTNTVLNDAFSKFTFDFNELLEVDIIKRSYKKMGVGIGINKFRI